MTIDAQAVANHYGRSELTGVLLTALQDAGVDIDNLTPLDLAPLDQFHSRGLEATRELSDVLDAQSDDHVLDIGCGIGGAMRFISDLTGCKMTGIDLTPEFCQAGQEFNKRTGLSDRVDCQTGNALSLQFGDESFDKAYSQFVVMNIEDRAGFCSEVFRVLKPGGRFVLTEIAEGPLGKPDYPMPWALTEATSFVQTPVTTKTVLQNAGFEIISQRDTKNEAFAFQKEMEKKTAKDGSPKLGVHLILPNATKEILGGVIKNIAKGLALPIETVCQKPRH